MKIFNTFWLIFRSNASEVIKGNKEIEKSTKDTQKALQNTADTTQELGKSFTKMIEGFTGVAGAFAGYSLMKNGLDNAIAYNAQLKIMGDLSSQNAQMLKTMGTAAAAAGGTTQGALSDIANLNSYYRRTFRREMGPADKVFDQIRDRLKPMDPTRRALALDQMGINDPGNRRLLSIMSDAEYANSKVKAFSRLTPEDQKAAMDKVSADALLEGSKGNFFTSVFGKIGSYYNKITGGQSSAVNYLADHPNAATASFFGIPLGGGLAAKWLGGLFGRGVSGLRAAAPVWDGISGVGAPAAAGGAAVGGLMALGVGEVAYGLRGIYKTLPGAIEELKAIFKNNGPRPSVTGALQSPGGDLGFWMSKGYTREQAAAIVANMKQESGGNPAARGDNGLAHGLFQWHPDRRSNILKSTGVDVSKASYGQQLEAAAWEMKNGRPGFNDEYFRSLKSADAAAAYFSQMFESPAHGAMQAVLRGRSALAIASQFPSGAGGNTSNSVKIDKIEINTQATDAVGIARDLRDEVYTALNFLAGNNDDGVAR